MTTGKKIIRGLVTWEEEIWSPQADPASRINCVRFVGMDYTNKVSIFVLPIHTLRKTWWAFEGGGERKNYLFNFENYLIFIPTVYSLPIKIENYSLPTHPSPSLPPEGRMDYFDGTKTSTRKSVLWLGLTTDESCTCYRTTPDCINSAWKRDISSFVFADFENFCSFLSVRENDEPWYARYTFLINFGKTGVRELAWENFSTVT